MTKAVKCLACGLYYNERWEAWSDWSSSAVSSSSDRQVETRTVYRYRTKGA